MKREGAKSTALPRWAGPKPYHRGEGPGSRRDERRAKLCMRNLAVEELNALAKKRGPLWHRHGMETSLEGGFCCTIMYRPPELWGAARRLKAFRNSPAVDIFSFGVTMFPVLTGSRPWGGGQGRFGKAFVQKLAQRLFRELREDPQQALGEVSKAAGVPQRVISLMYRCVSWRPEDRPTAAEALSEIEAALEEVGGEFAGVE